MALIKCKNCGAEITDNSTKCYKCGATNQEKEKIEKTEKQRTEQQANIFASILAIIIIVGIYFLLTEFWKEIKGDKLIEGLGIETNESSITFKGKDENKLDDWKNDAMNFFGLEYTEK